MALLFVIALLSLLPAIRLLLIRKQYVTLVIFLLVLRIIYIREFESKVEKSKAIRNKSNQNVVEDWIINEVQISRNKLNDFQSAGVCENEQRLAICVNDIIVNLKDTNRETTNFKSILYLTSNESLIEKLLKEAIKKKKHLALFNWLYQNKLLNKETPYLLDTNFVQSLEDLAALRFSSDQLEVQKVRIFHRNRQYFQ